MSGMVSTGRNRTFGFGPSYTEGADCSNSANDAADDIVASPDKFLLSQQGLFEAEGGWGTFALTVGLGIGGAAALVAVSPKHGTYLAGG